MTDTTTAASNTITRDDLLAENITDVGLADLLARLHDGNLLFAGGTWLLWDGARWQPDGADKVLQLVVDMLKQLRATAEQSRHHDSAKKVTGAMSTGRMKSIIELAATNERLRRHPGDFDSDPNHLNFLNGTLDLRTLQLQPHDPSQLITKRIDFPYDPNAVAPRWQRFQREVTGDDEGLIRFKQKMYGQALLGTLPEQKTFFLLGNGANGKSVELETLKATLGPYATTVPGEAFLKSSKGDPRNTYARLPGVRVAIGSEIDERQPLAEGAIKSLTGGEELTARRLYKDEFTFHPMCTLFIATNHLPRVIGDDYGIRRRLVAIPYPVTFAPDVQDPGLKRVLIQEGPGILAWLVEGLRLYQAEGLKPPQAIQQATRGFWQQADSVKAWLDGATESDSEAQWTAASAFASYHEFCVSNGIQPLTRTAFGTRMNARGFNEPTGRRRQNSDGCRVYVGIRPPGQTQAPAPTLN